MNNPPLDNKILQDVATVKKDTSILVGDSTVRLGRFGDEVNQASEEFNTWMGDSVIHLGKGFGKMTSGAREIVGDASATVKKDVGLGLGQFNTKAQEIADKVPGGFARKIARYPWVTLAITLAGGFLLGRLLNPARLSGG